MPEAAHWHGCGKLQELRRLPGILRPSRIRVGRDGRMQILHFPIYKIGIIYSYLAEDEYKATDAK